MGTVEVGAIFRLQGGPDSPPQLFLLQIIIIVLLRIALYLQHIIVNGRFLAKIDISSAPQPSTHTA